MLQTHNLTFQYTEEVKAFSFPDFKLAPQEHLLILGKSGIGKTTLLHLLAGLLPPKTGTITIGDTVINGLSNRKLDAFRGKHVGLVFQKNHVVQSLSVIDNLKMRLLFSNATHHTSKIEQLLEQLDLTDCKTSKAQHISGGQLQRLSIALSVIHSPNIILADEPTSSLDDENCHNVMTLLLEQAAQTNANLIVITHDQRVRSLFQNSITL